MFWIEAAAVCFGIACVALTIRQSIWCWPAGLVQVSLYVFVFHSARLYSDMLLHVVYIVLQIYGWQHWLRGGRGDERLPVTRLSTPHRAAMITGTLAAAYLWGELMARFTDAAAPHADAFIAAASLSAQYLLARKKAESWILWIAVDVVAIFVYWSRDLQLTAALYGLFLVLSVAGWVEWKKSLVASSAGTVRMDPAT